MKVIIVALALMAIAAAAPAEYEPPKILRSNFEQNNAGGYAYSFESEDGTQRDEKGDLKEVLDEENKPHLVIVVRGSYSYVNKDGKPETVNYYADEFGYHAEGDTIPKAQSRK